LFGDLNYGKDNAGCRETLSIDSLDFAKNSQFPKGPKIFVGRPDRINVVKSGWYMFQYRKVKSRIK